MTSTQKSALVKLASSLPAKSPERRVIMAFLTNDAKAYYKRSFDLKMDIMGFCNQDRFFVAFDNETGAEAGNSYHKAKKLLLAAVKHMGELESEMETHTYTNPYQD